MKKQAVLNHFGGTSATSRALGVSKTTVSLWKDHIPWQYALLVSEVTEQSLKFDRDDYPERFKKIIHF